MPRPVKAIDLSFWFRHTVTVERYAGTGAYGDVYDDPEQVLALIDDTERLVRDATGEEITSSTTVAMPAATADVPPKSRVTLPDTFAGRVSTVITESRHDAVDMPVPDFLEVALL